MVLALFAAALLASPDAAAPRKLLTETGFGEDEVEAAIDAIGRFSQAMDARVGELQRQFLSATEAPAPAKEDAAPAKDRVNTSFDLGKGVEVLASRVFGVPDPDKATWRIKVTLANGPRAAVYKLQREGDRDALGRTHTEATRTGLCIADVIAALEAGKIFVDTVCEPARCTATIVNDPDRGSHSLWRGPAAGVGAQAQKAATPDWVLLGSGAEVREQQPILYGVGSSQPARNRALRLHGAEVAAQKDLTTLLLSFVDEVAARASLPKPAEGFVPKLGLTGAIDQRFEQDDVAWARAKLEVEAVVAALVASGLPIEKVRPAADKAFKELLPR